MTRVTLWLVVGVATATLSAPVIAHQSAYSAALRETSTRVADVTAALTSAAADSVVTKDEITAAGVRDGGEDDDGRRTVYADLRATRTWWFGTTEAEKSVTWYIQGTDVYSTDPCC